MKKILFLAAFSLLAGTIVSCDNDASDDGVQHHAYATDDGLLPIKPPTTTPPPTTLPPKGGG